MDTGGGHCWLWGKRVQSLRAVETTATGCPSGIKKSLCESGGACLKTHYRQRLIVGSWVVGALWLVVPLLPHIKDLIASSLGVVKLNFGDYEI